MKKILVTGGSGLVGKEVCRDLASDYKISVLDKIKPAFEAQHFRADVTRSDSLKSVKGKFDAIIHLAGIPHPLNDPADKVFHVNTLGTFNIMRFAADRGIKKVILASSESTLGFAFARRPHSPAYLPVDEQHPLGPQDAYGLSKVCAEETLRSFSRAYGIHTVALRFPWIWVPRKPQIEMYKELILHYEKWHKNLWAWVNVHDAAMAFAGALEHPGSSFERFFIAADDNWTDRSSMELIRKYYPDTQIVRPMDGTRSLISNDFAKAVLGFRPVHSATDTVN